ncbi:MAG: hypothetical protein H9W83_02345 [Leuconostoc sp.]|nr:hypothetical protein [Leuconostoc sp.]
MKHFLKIDESGFLLFGEDLLIPVTKDESENEEYIPAPEGFIETPLPTNEKGEQIGFYRPKWNGTEWIEGATEEEIADHTKEEPLPLSQEERIRELESIVNLLLMGGL